MAVCRKPRCAEAAFAAPGGLVLSRRRILNLHKLRSWGSRQGGLLGSQQRSFPAASAVPSLSATGGEEPSGPWRCPGRPCPAAVVRRPVPAAGAPAVVPLVEEQESVGKAVPEAGALERGAVPAGAGAAPATQAAAPAPTNSSAIPAQPACAAPKQAARK